MSLIMRIAGKESISRLERAAISRHSEGRHLVSADYSFWAVYTLGYVVEILLKSAFFRLCGLSPREDVAIYLKLARAWSGQLGIGKRARNLHDLVFWLDLLILERQFLGRPLAADFALDLSLRVKQVANHWREDMRYVPSVFARRESEEVKAATSWIVQNQDNLWN